MNIVPLTFHPYLYYYKKLHHVLVLPWYKWASTYALNLFKFASLAVKISITIYTPNKETNKYLIFTGCNLKYKCNLMFYLGYTMVHYQTFQE